MLQLDLNFLIIFMIYESLGFCFDNIVKKTKLL